MDDLSRLLQSKLDDRLKKHISCIDLASVSRIPAGRFEKTALPNIGLIELVSGSAFRDDYDELYKSNFHGGERERSDLIIDRLRGDFAGRREGLAPYRIIGLRDRAGRAIAGAQFSVLFLEDGRHAVPYLQYIYVWPGNRRQDLSELMHTLVLAVAMADAAKVKGTREIEVPFTLFETEPPVHGTDDGKRATAAQRTNIHSRSGAMALMLRRKSSGQILSAHVQPGLEGDDPPLTLIWALRANPVIDLVLQDDQTGKALLKSYYQSLRDEGFPKENIALAEGMFEERYRGKCEFHLLPLSEVTREMYVNIDGGRSREQRQT